jgi:integrase
LKRSTATVNRKQAQKIADEYEAAARRKRTALQVRRVITQLHQEITGDEVSQTSLRNFLNSWLGRKASETAHSTLAFYRNAANKFLAFLGDTADADLTEITREHITRFRNEEAKWFAPKTVSHEVKFLRMILRAARRDALVGDDSAEFVDTIQKGKATVPRPFTIPELKAALSVADDEWRSMVNFVLYTGQRLGDIATLTWQNIDLQQGEIRLITRKTHKTLILPIAVPLRRHIEALPTSDDPAAPLHPSAFAIVTNQGKSGHLSNQFADLLAEAGLLKKKAHRKAEHAGFGRGRSTFWPRDQSVFRWEGDYWTIRYQGQAAILKATRGLDCLGHLLRHPRREIHVSELLATLIGVPVPALLGGLREVGGHAVTTGLQDAGPILDSQAKAEYKRRINELRDDLGEAERFNDSYRATRARSEIDAIVEQLAAAVGLGGRDRPSSSEAERARSAVTKRIKEAIGRIGEVIPPLGRHLAARIKTGYFCSYNPHPDRPVAWKF